MDLNFQRDPEQSRLLVSSDLECHKPNAQACVQATPQARILALKPPAGYFIYYFFFLSASFRLFPYICKHTHSQVLFAVGGGGG